MKFIELYDASMCGHIETQVPEIANEREFFMRGGKTWVRYPLTEQVQRAIDDFRNGEFSIFAENIRRVRGEMITFRKENEKKGHSVCGNYREQIAHL